MEISEAIKFLESRIGDPKQGLPEEIFLFVSRLTPLVNVDLLIRDEKGRTLLAWRDDQYAGTGWHLPGGILRAKERMETRLRKVAAAEVGAEVEFDPVPLAINQMIGKNDTRGHFISILYQCFLSGRFVPENRGLKAADQGFLRWHETCPDDLIKVHEIYRKMMESPAKQQRRRS